MSSFPWSATLQVSDVRRLADAVPARLSYIDAQRHYRFVNRAYEEWFGRPREEIEGRHIRDVLGEESYAAIEPHVEAALAGKRVTYEISMAHPEGDPKVLQVAYVPRAGADGQVRGFIALVVDITERKRAEQALRAIILGTGRATGEDFFHSLASNLASALGVRLVFVCEGIADMPTRARVLALSTEVLPAGLEYDLAGTPCQEVLNDAQARFYRDNVQDLFPDDVWLKEWSARSYLAVPFLDAAGRAIGHMGVVHDRPIVDEEYQTSILRVFATRAGAELERKRTEKALREREQQFRESQKMEAIGTFASGIAHDLSNMLGAMRGYAELALPDIPAGTSTRQNLREILHAADRARTFVQQILLFGRPEGETRDVVRLGSLVGEVLDLAHLSLPDRVDLRRRCMTDQDELWGDADQLQRVVFNLYANARQAMGEDGVLEVTVDHVDGSPDTRTAVGILQAKPYVRLTVRDTGHGILPEVVPHLFEPFFTTRGRRDGSGLGLALVERIVTSHGGAIDVHSQPGQGATFEVFLPHLAAARRPTENGPPPRASGRLLLVDDDLAFLRMQAKRLESIGYEVVPCTTGPEALAVFAQAPGEFAAVLTDHNMPEMTGAALATRLIAIRPEIPVILCTAFARTIGPERVVASGIRHVLHKPGSLRELAEAVQRATNGDHPGEGPHDADAGDRR